MNDELARLVIDFKRAGLLSGDEADALFWDDATGDDTFERVRDV